MYPYHNTKLTVELRELVENGVDIWDFDYPSYYQGEAKKAFERKVIDHYYFRQIGQETTGRFLHYFRTRVREIMPYFIQRYKSVELMEKIEDPFESYNLTETYSQERKGTGKGSSSSTSQSTSESSSSQSENTTDTISEENEKRFSNTPQGSIANLDKYLTEATVDKKTGDHTVDNSSESSTDASTSSTGSSEHETEDNETVTHTLTRKGNIGVATLAQEMNSFRTSFLNVDMEVIEALKDLFLLVY